MEIRNNKMFKHFCTKKKLQIFEFLNARMYATPETAIGRTPIFHGDQPTFSSYEPSSQMKYSDKILVAEKLQHILRDQQQLQQQQQQQQHQQPYQQQPVRYAHTEVSWTVYNLFTFRIL